MKLDITREEKYDLVRGLQIRICLIETGDPVMRASDAANCGEHKKIKALSDDQRELVCRHEALVTRLMNAS